MNELDYKIKHIEYKNQSELNKTPTERREDKLKELNSKLMEARSKYESGPLDIETAEKKYYTLKEGPLSYEMRKMNKYKEEADDLKTEMLSNHQEDMKQAFQALSYYNSQQSYSSDVNASKLILLKEIKNKLQELKTEYANKTTNNRKSYYVLQEQESVTFWLQVLNHCLIAFAIVFIIYSVREKHVTNYTYLIVVGILFLIYGLEWIIKFIRSIPLSFNIYTSWGEDTDHPSYTFYSIVVISAILLLIIYKKNSDIDNYFK